MSPVSRLLRILVLALTGLLAAGPPALAAPPELRGRIQAALEVQGRHAPGLLGRAGVVAAGVGLGRDGEPVIRIFTEGTGRLDLPSHLEGVRVETRRSGRFYALRGPTCETEGDQICEPDERWPLPVPTGTSIGHPSITAGTIGARVTDGPQVFALSNNHVIAASNLATLGDEALAPGPFDGGSSALGDAIGTLHSFAPIVFCELWPLVCSFTNDFDAAIAISSPAELGFATPLGELGSQPGYGAPSSLLHSAYGVPDVIGDAGEDLSLLLGEPVQKYGRTTGLTQDVIDTVGMEADVCYDELCNQVGRFVDQIGINGPFSAGGDSGSLVVTDDGVRRSVGLLFAGSETDSIVSRIDKVLGHFQVEIDDGGAAEPVTDVAVQGIATPSFGLTGQTSQLTVTVRNLGTEPTPAFSLELADDLDTSLQVLPAPALAPAAQADVVFDWTPVALGVHTLTATALLGDDQPANDQNQETVSVFAEPPGVQLSLWKGQAHTFAWTQVTLPFDYGTEMVPICTPVYTVGGLGPLIARVRNATGSSFEVGLGRPWFLAFPGEDTSGEVQCMVVRAGVYDEPGFRLEAHRIEGFSSNDGGFVWNGEAQAYAQAYTAPVVLGQVVSTAALPGDTAGWTQFWARGATAFEPPSAASLFVGRHSGEDPAARPPETLVYAVFEAGTGDVEGRRFVAGVGPETIQGMEDAPPYDYALPTHLARATHAVATSAGMDGIEGAWPVLYGPPAFETDVLHLAMEEDWYFDPERMHPVEQVAYVVFGPLPSKCGLGMELALLAPLLGSLRRRRRSWAR